MYSSRRPNERTALRRPLEEPDYVEFASLLRTRRSRIKQFQCCVCATLIAVFTMILIVTVSYSVSHDTIDNAPNLTISSTENLDNQSGALKLGLAAGTYNILANDPSVQATTKEPPTNLLSDEEIQEGLAAGREAMDQRSTADTAALASPLPSPSPESRHRHAVSTCSSVGVLALAAVGEIAATKKIEKSRMNKSAASSFGCFFDGGWMSSGTCKKFQALNCTISKYRSYDGSCNRLMHRGASMMPFRRVLAPSYADGIDVPRKALSGKDLPSAREISLKVHRPSPSSNPAFTVMLAVYGQFLDHDITATAISQGVNGSSISCCPPTVGHPECFPVRVGTGDPLFDVAGRTCIEFARSAPAPQCMLGPRQQLSQVSAFIDGSTIYGSDERTARGLREFAGGRLRMQRTPDNRTLLPASTNPNDGCNREAERARGRYCFAAGDARANENLHLTTMHLLWARQHNKIAAELSRINPSWNDETVFEESRRIVGAQLQHITYQEFLPIILGEQEAKSRDLKPLKTGYRDWAKEDDATNDPTIANNFASAAFRFAHTLLPGLMRVTDEQKGTSSYVELHRMLFNPYSLYGEDGVRNSIDSATGNVVQLTSPHVTSQLTSHLFEDPIGNATVPCGLDLVSLNIQRGRDHGLPGYARWREFCGSGKVEDFSDLEGHLDPQALEGLSMLYESVHDVDLYTGALAELSGSGGIVGPTFSCLIADQFSRLQRGDRFWYEVSSQPHSFAKGQLLELRKTSLAKLICDTSDGVKEIQARIMRTVGPGNPMASCEDIPEPSFEPWREDKSGNLTLKASSAKSSDWMDLKTNINDTIRDIVAFINATRSSVKPESTDWFAFKDYINNTFSDLRNQLVDLHPPKILEASRINEKSSMNPDTFILRAASPASSFQGWINFKFDLVKSLNDSIGKVGGGPVATAEWINFKRNIVGQFDGLKNQMTSVKSTVGAKLPAKKYGKEEASMIPMAAIFDWKNFKDDTIRSLEDAIIKIGNDMPPPGDPAWADFGADLKNRFFALRDKMNRTGISGDWLSYKADIVNTINKAVKKIEDGMPPPGDPAWATYRDDIIKSFSAFGKPSRVEAPGLSSSFEGTAAQRRNLGAAPPIEFTSNELSNLTTDWIDFRNKINDSLSQVVGDIRSKKARTIDPVGWIAFRDSAMNEFAVLKNEIAAAKAEWCAEIDNLKSNKTLSLSLGVGTSKKDGSFNKFDYASFARPVIPVADWIAFKNSINNTLTSLLIAANTTENINFDDTQRVFNESFEELKVEIESLKDFILKNAPDHSKIASNSLDWSNFRGKLNSTVSHLVENLGNASGTTIGETMKILFQTRDELSDLEPPGEPFVDWTKYAFGINKTIVEALKSLTDSKHVTTMIKATNPAQSSSLALKFFQHWLLLPCAVTLFQFQVGVPLPANIYLAC